MSERPYDQAYAERADAIRLVLRSIDRQDFGVFVTARLGSSVLLCANGRMAEELVALVKQHGGEIIDIGESNDG